MNRTLKLILAAVLILAVISTVSYCSAPYDTETAQKINIRRTVSGQGYILRRETPVKQSSRAMFEPRVQDGARVFKGSSVGVAISGNYNESLVRKLTEVTERIEEIKKSGNFADIYSSDEARVFSALKDMTSLIRENVRDGDFSSATSNTAQLNTILSRKYSAENEGAAAELLSSLEDEKYEIEQQLGGIREDVKASASGYFYSRLDGLESTLDEEELFKLTTVNIDKFTDKLKEYKPEAQFVGKVTDTFVWYLAAVLPSEEAEKLEIGKEVKISIDEATEVKATVSAINHDEFGRSAIVVKSTRDVSGIFEKRTVSFEICYEEYNGLYVPSAAIRVVDGVTGVYILSANGTPSFRCVKILLKEEEFYIVHSSYTPPEENQIKALRLYDNILVNPEAVRNYES